ncbi:hypothetical protein PUNSTDRAFT_96583 [Punctularia strigosozonata HHB-11173 SS5]|uniref:uncharacterized protein n=1 Tax=Punctularia strigosozonata (strain HHB-11173) TaxID=741275 RepID=UPI0004417C5A|nr:uncharacterized protein PUNSTDRAFT_96583 [Punctularia strigosozonata HHB-11173 SS5]EIN14614.1 hypothetical protein PUNSTDRAFT_96583 [Punctularia strigosozonata HHB-11173 SS5]
MIYSLLPLILVAPAVWGHGQLRNFIASSGTWSAADAYTTANASSPIRHVNTYGPVPDFTTADVTCGPGGNIPTTVLAPVKAGETVIFDWGSWTSDHPGPVMTYIAACTGGCANFKGDTGNVWVKIDQDVYYPDRTTPGPWGEHILHLTPSYYQVTIPAGLADGEYLLRHEILGLHVAGTYMGAQFYPQCVQVTVTNGGSVTLPQGVPLPGSYNPNDTSGVLVQLWQIEANPSQLYYIAPGGPVVLPGGTGDWGRATYAGTPQPPLASSSASASSTVASTTSLASSTVITVASPSSTSTAPVASGSAIAKYGQCGGQGWTGSTVCAAGSTCTTLNTYYSQCL